MTKGADRPSAGSFVRVTHHVDDVAIGSSNEEPSNSPRLVGERVNDLVAPALCFSERLVDLSPDVHRDDRVMRGGCVAGHELDNGSAVGRSEVRHPAKVESLDGQAQVTRVEVAGGC